MRRLRRRLGFLYRTILAYRAIGFTEVVVVCTNERAYLAISREAVARWADQESRLRVVQAQDFCA